MKTNLILKLYDSLINGEVVSREKFCRKYAISARTFYRYIDDVRCFLQSEHPDSPLAKTGIDNCYYIKFAAKPGAKKSTLPRRLEPDTSEPDLFVESDPADRDVAEPVAFDSDAPVFAQPETEPSAIM